MSKKIIFFSTPAYGHLTPTYPVIKKLINFGYDVDWYCSNKFKAIVQKSGANFIEYAIDFEKECDLTKATKDFYSLLETLIKLNNEGFLAYKDLNYENVDLILYDSMISFAKNIAKQKQIRSICFCTTIAFNPFVFIFSNMFLPTVALFSKHIADFYKLINEQNSFRKKNNVEKIHLLDLFMNIGDKTIVFTPKEFQPYYNTFSKDYCFVGPEMEDRFVFKDDKYTDKYDIYYSLGSIFNGTMDDIKQFKNDVYFKDKKLIINVGSSNELENANHDLQAENITLAKYTNQFELLKNCKIFINQGGINSCFEAIYNKVFQICIPSQKEQALMSRIIARRNVGIYLKKFNISKIKKAIKKFNKDKKYENYIEKYSKIISESHGSIKAFNIIKEYLGD